MSTYKVIQNVEAEDKILGPLSFRQFAYAGIAAIFGYLSFFLITHGAPFLATPFIPLVLISAFFAWPWGRDQPTEVWALAQIRYFFKPRKRIWSQSGTKELVTITVPKRIAIDYTNGLNQIEVRSRLKVLADTLDSHGWAIKDVNVNLAAQSYPAITTVASDDRLLSLDSMPKIVSDVEVRASDDIMDERNNPIAQQFDSMIADAAKSRRAKILASMQQQSNQPAPPSPAGPAATTDNTSRWFLSQQPTQPAVSTPQNAVTFNEQVVSPSSGNPVSTPATATTDDELATDEESLLKAIEKAPTPQGNPYGHLHTIMPLSARPQPKPATPPPVTPSTSAGILDLASNNDLNVATIAREANKRRQPTEVVISLH
ncbi:MAG TPA: PrgI family protein [Candidatus Saccharimonadales bacterium]|nr:PrgI family protein [Candidatus Saccharimonadales bacterium]